MISPQTKGKDAVQEKDPDDYKFKVGKIVILPCGTEFNVSKFNIDMNVPHLCIIGPGHPRTD